MPSSRVDYDLIAEGYDRQPYRGKTVDPELAAFPRARPDHLCFVTIRSDKPL
jgi:hypothetical protein